MGKILFCYWRARGLAAAAKMLLEYGGLEYEVKIMRTEEEWMAQKFTLGLDFPNLPYIVDGDVKLTESWAIFKYLAKKVGAFPITTDEEVRNSDMLQGVIEEVRSNFSRIYYLPNLYEQKDEKLETQLVKIRMLEKYLESRKFLLGDKLSYLDFVLWETLDHHRLFYTGILGMFPRLQAFMKSFESIEPLAAYFSSDRFKPFPIGGPEAVWGSKDYNDFKN